MLQFLNGVAACGSIVAGALFLRFWRDTADRLFLWFALAFWIFAVNWTASALMPPADEARPYFFMVRLAGFVLILIAIIDKNRTAGSGR